MKLLQNPLYRINSIVILQGCTAAVGTYVLLHIADAASLFIIAFTATIALLTWSRLHHDYADYVTNAEAPIATLTFLAAMMLFHSLIAAAIAAFVVLWAYNYFFDFSPSFPDSLLIAAVFIVILVFAAAYIHHSEYLAHVPINIFSGIVADSTTVSILFLISVMIFLYTGRTRYELLAISSGHHYYDILSVHTHTIHLIMSLLKTAVAIIIFLLIGWLGALLLTIPFLRTLNTIASMIVLTVWIAVLLLAADYINPFYIIMPLVAVNFILVLFLQKRALCSH